MSDKKQMSMSEAKRKSIQWGLTDVQQELCMYFNECFFNSSTNPITMAMWITDRFDVKLTKKKVKRA